MKREESSYYDVSWVVFFFTIKRGGEARTAATVSELISLLRSKLDMSSALVVPEQDQAIMITSSTLMRALRALTI